MELRLNPNVGKDESLAKLLSNINFNNVYMTTLSKEMLNYLNGYITAKEYSIAISNFY